MRKHIGALAVLAVVAALAQPALGQSQYRMVDLGTLGGAYSSATAINSSGQVCGYAYTADWKMHAFVWDEGTGMVDLDEVDGPASEARAINASGQVCGYYNTPDWQARAFVWDKSTGVVDLGPGGATGINESGQVCGYTGSGHPFVWDPVEGMLDLGSLAMDEAYAIGINDSGQICGYRYTARPNPLYGWGVWSMAFVWDPTTGLHDLTPSDTMSQAVAINAAGQTCGIVLNEAGEILPFVWGPVGAMRVLEVPDAPMWTDIRATSINDAGQVCGTAYDSSYQKTVVIWDNSGEAHRLGPCGACQPDPVGINSAGQVCGVEDAYGRTAAVIWDPVTGEHSLGWLGGYSSVPAAMNAIGQVCGGAETAVGEWHAFVTAEVPAPPTASYSFTYDDGINTAYGVLRAADVGYGASAAETGAMWVVRGPSAGAFNLHRNPIAPAVMAVVVGWYHYFAFDNLIYPGHEVKVDWYGLLFEAPGGVVNIWGNGPYAPYTFYAYDTSTLEANAGEGVFTLAATAAEQVANLQTIVGMLVGASELAAADSKPLTTKLEAAAASVARGNANASRGQLGAFANHVRALVHSGRLDAAKGQSLVDLANAASDAAGL